MEQSLIYEVRNLLTKPTGSKQEYEMDLKSHFEDKEISQGKRITAKLILRKIPDGIHAELRNLEIPIFFECVRCLQPFLYPLLIEQAEGQFYLEKPQGVLIEEEVFFIDKKKLTIDLTEMLRQEILLHFPSVPLCSKSCQGLCDICGKNLKEEPCDCSHTSTQEEKPLHHLKKLLS